MLPSVNTNPFNVHGPSIELEVAISMFLPVFNLK